MYPYHYEKLFCPAQLCGIGTASSHRLAYSSPTNSLSFLICLSSCFWFQTQKQEDRHKGKPYLHLKIHRSYGYVDTKKQRCIGPMRTFSLWMNMILYNTTHHVTHKCDARTPPCDSVSDHPSCVSVRSCVGSMDSASGPPHSFYISTRSNLANTSTDRYLKIKRKNISNHLCLTLYNASCYVS